MDLTTGNKQTVREQMQARLDALKKELETGQADLHKVENQRTYLLETLLRISGAIQVLEELLTEARPAGQNGVIAEGSQRAAAQSRGDGVGGWKTRGSA